MTVVPESNVTYKFAVLIWLVLQTSIHTLLLRYSRTREIEEMYFASVAVFLTELMKGVICLYIVISEMNGIKEGFLAIYHQIFFQPWDTLKVCIPAILYTIQNNLHYVAGSNLDAATFLIACQLKIFATAFFSVLLLRRNLERCQWVSLVMLFIGVSLVQLQTGGASSSESGSHNDNVLLGFAAVCVSCAISGYAGVYFEKILKGSAPVSLWMRNIQMCVFAIPASFAAVVLQDGKEVLEHGFLSGFDSIVWLAVFWYAIGGLSVAVCVKYADNIAKNFASSFAIILSTIGSMYFFGFIPNLTFVLGTALVISSVFLYSSPESISNLFGRKPLPATNIV